MTRYGAQFGPDITYLGVDRCDLDDPATVTAVADTLVGTEVLELLSALTVADAEPLVDNITARPPLAVASVLIVPAGDIASASGAYLLMSCEYADAIDFTRKIVICSLLMSSR